jgi:formylglycine-generating enzyme required for sulfatase activity
MKNTCILATAVLALTVAASRANITIETVTIGNPGNADDTVASRYVADAGLYFGGVNYVYAIGTYEVTNIQYAAFLNAVAKTDPYGLYNPTMATSRSTGGITRSGTSGNYSYAVIAGMGNHPVTFVSWFDTARFMNWLQNGQPTGLGEVAASTEQGAYTLNGATSGLFFKNSDAQYWIPTEDEWYKAAYYDPNKNGPGLGGYWAFATQSDTPPGNVVGSAPNQANYIDDHATHVHSVTQSVSFDSTQNYLTDVGAFSGSASAYGTFDQNGNVFEWNDAVRFTGSRGLRGGQWNTGVDTFLSSGRGSNNPTFETTYALGFRIATVPEPSVGVSLLLASGLFLARRMRTSPR